MLIKSNEEIILKEKAINHVISSKTGKEYDLSTLYLEDKQGAVTQLVVNNMIYNKAEIGKKYILKVLLDYQGKLQINDIELVKN